MNRIETLKPLMTQALIEPVVMTLADEKTARAWRWTCYHIRQVEPMFKELKFSVTGKRLTMEVRSTRTD